MNSWIESLKQMTASANEPYAIFNYINNSAKFLLAFKLVYSFSLQGILLDLLQRARRMEEVVVPQQILDAESTVASEQTLFERQGRYTALLRRLPGNKDKLLSSTITTAVPLLVNLNKI